mmetsp:Transcript_88269/g.170934  ORF Transcript_88269/g.170934 Transcript_88269/m.170934 type:complete len:319 (-) Transcript_88269:152-1108(-)
MGVKAPRFCAQPPQELAKLLDRRFRLVQVGVVGDLDAKQASEAHGLPHEHGQLRFRQRPFREQRLGLQRVRRAVCDVGLVGQRGLVVKREDRAAELPFPHPQARRALRQVLQKTLPLPRLLRDSFQVCCPFHRPPQQVLQLSPLLPQKLQRATLLVFVWCRRRRRCRRRRSCLNTRLASTKKRKGVVSAVRGRSGGGKKGLGQVVAPLAPFVDLRHHARVRFWVGGAQRQQQVRQRARRGVASSPRRPVGGVRFRCEQDSGHGLGGAVSRVQLAVPEQGEQCQRQALRPRGARPWALELGRECSRRRRLRVRLLSRRF